MPEIEAIATEVLLEIEEQRISRVVPTARAVNLTMNRGGIRRLAAEELQIATSAYRFATSLEELHESCSAIGYPCFIIKPFMSSSGKGQLRITSAAEIENAWEYANIYSGKDGVALEYNNITQALSYPRSDLRLFGKPEKGLPNVVWESHLLMQIILTKQHERSLIK